MNEKAHFNPKSLKWIISLVVMIIVSAGVVFGSKAAYDAANAKYYEHVDSGFTIATAEALDISATNAGSLGVTSAQRALDAGGKTVAYIVEGTTVGYNEASPIEMSTVISADGSLVCSVDILRQEETEYLGVRIETQAFKDQFTGRRLPVILSRSLSRGSKIDILSGATVSTEAVVNGVNNAQQFVLDNYAASNAA